MSGTWVIFAQPTYRLTRGVLAVGSSEWFDLLLPVGAGQRPLPVGFGCSALGYLTPRLFGAFRGMLCLLRFVSTKHLFVLVTGAGTVMPHFPGNGIYAAMIPKVEAAIMALPDWFMTSFCFHSLSYVIERRGSRLFIIVHSSQDGQLVAHPVPTPGESA